MSNKSTDEKCRKASFSIDSILTENYSNLKKSKKQTQCEPNSHQSFSDPTASAAAAAVAASAFFSQMFKSFESSSKLQSFLAKQQQQQASSTSVSSMSTSSSPSSLSPITQKQTTTSNPDQFCQFSNSIHPFLNLNLNQAAVAAFTSSSSSSSLPNSSLNGRLYLNLKIKELRKKIAE